MLTVRTLLKESSIHGFGVFADENIKKGQTIWKFNALIDRIISAQEMDELPAHTAAYLAHYCEYFPQIGVFVLSGDHDRFTNHSDNPNSEVILPNGPHASVIASRDIAMGEEITCDYGVVQSLAWVQHQGAGLPGALASAVAGSVHAPEPIGLSA